MSELVYAGERELRVSLLTPARVRELSQCRPGRVVLDTAVTWATIVAVWAAAVAIGSWWAKIAAAIISGNRYYSLWIIGHDGLHRRLFQSTFANDLFNDLLVLGPIGAITRINNRNHLSHHQHLGTGDDPDRYKHACFNKATRPQLIGYLLAVTSVVPAVIHVFSRRNQVKVAKQAHSPDGPRYRPRDLAILAGWQAGLLAFFTIFFGWWSYFALWWLPVFVFVFLADNLRTFVEHSHPEGDEQADTHRLITNHPSWLERQLLSPMNMNYHAAHHLWTSIPYYNLPIADAEMRESPKAKAITWRGSYLTYLGRYFRVLPLTECLRPATGAPTVT